MSGKGKEMEEVVRELRMRAATHKEWDMEYYGIGID